jgi:hypothetical protein
VLPASQRGLPCRWASHKQLAAKALKKLAGPHLPASLTRLEQAVKRADNVYAKADRAQHEERQAAYRHAAETDDQGPHDARVDEDPADEQRAEAA